MLLGRNILILLMHKYFCLSCVYHGPQIYTLYHVIPIPLVSVRFGSSGIHRCASAPSICFYLGAREIDRINLNGNGISVNVIVSKIKLISVNNHEEFESLGKLNV